MKSYKISIIILLLSQLAYSQSKNNQKEIHKVLNTFMECLVKKDSTKFYSIFHSDPVVWVGVTSKKTFENELKKDSIAVNYFSSNYKSFYRHFYNKEIEEKFYNIQILEDGYIATVSFNYSFWNNKKKTNWGKEIWTMIKTNGQWKITSVIFSTEDEDIYSEPKLKRQS